jgi:hypothetical protein
LRPLAFVRYLKERRLSVDDRFSTDVRKTSVVHVERGKLFSARKLKSVFRGCLLSHSGMMVGIFGGKVKWLNRKRKRAESENGLYGLYGLDGRRANMFWAALVSDLTL